MNQELDRIKDMYPYIPIKKEYIINKYGYINYFLILINTNYRSLSYKVGKIVKELKNQYKSVIKTIQR